MTDIEREAMLAAMDHGIPADMRREMGEQVEDDESLEMTGDERIGFEAGWRARAKWGGRELG